MYLETKRIFISDLPEKLSNEDIVKRFSKYGTVSSVDIRERKNLGPKNNSKLFAFVNVEIDAGSLQKCFQDICSKQWEGHYVHLQLARENFLDRLKKEREEVNQSQSSTPKINEPLFNKTPALNRVTNSITEVIPVIKNDRVDSSADSSDTEDETIATHVTKAVKQEKIKTELATGFADSNKLSNNFEENPDIVYKDNKSKIINNKLIIESVGNKPIYTWSPAKSKSLDPKRTEADNRRMQSMLEKRQGFNRQKLVIRNALAKIDVSPNLEYETFHNPSESSSTTRMISLKGPNLFENEDIDVEEYHFNLKKQFEGADGQRLLALQSNYKNDARFTLDERFMDQQEENMDKKDEDDLIKEKKKEYEIMDKILGTKVTPNVERQKNKLMLRFDPNQPEHSKYEIKEDDVEAKPAKKRKKERVEVVLPEVSQETFFDVDDKLKNALQEKSSFSLLGMFGQITEITGEDNNEIDKEPSRKIRKKNIQLHTENPFKYDSSDDEEQADIDNNFKNKKGTKKEKTDSATVSLGAKKMWTESLFFKEDDYRFQDGMEFVMKLGTEKTGEISEVRQEIRQIVRAKVLNNKGKNKMFKKKLGGQKKFKHRRS